MLPEGNIQAPAEEDFPRRLLLLVARMENFMDDIARIREALERFSPPDDPRNKPSGLYRNR